MSIGSERIPSETLLGESLRQGLVRQDRHMKLAAIALVLLTGSAQAETVSVKYWGDVDLASYECTDTVSSFVNRVCYDQAAGHVVVLLKATYYAYCNVDPGTVEQWLAADSKGRFYNQEIKDSATGGTFTCKGS